MQFSPDYSNKIPSIRRRVFERLLRTLYNALYHQLAWGYDAAAWLVSLGRWNECIHYFTKYIPAGSVLELGYGPGYLQADLAKMGYQRTGIDESREMSRITRNRLNKLDYPHNLVKGLVQTLPYPDSCFNSIVSTFPSPYIFDPVVLAEAYRVLVPDGEMIVMLSVLFQGEGFLKKVWSWFFQYELVPPYSLDILKNRFEQVPWQVEITTPIYQDNILLLVRCVKPKSAGLD